MQPPAHHVRYARAWMLHEDSGMPEHCKEILEREMDAAQNDFTYDEFQIFKITLPGFVEFWQGFKQDMDKALEKIKPKH